MGGKFLLIWQGILGLTYNFTSEIAKLPWQHFDMKFLDTINKPKAQDCKEN